MGDLTADIRCPHCGRINDQHDDAGSGDDRSPTDGDVGLCWGCTKLSIFVTVNGQLAQRVPTAKEAAMLAKHPDTVLAQSRVVAARAQLLPPSTVTRMRKRRD